MVEGGREAARPQDQVPGELLPAQGQTRVEFQQGGEAVIHIGESIY